MAGRRGAPRKKDFRSRVPGATWPVPPGQPGYDPFGDLAIAYQVAPDLGVLSTEIRRLALDPSQENIAAVAQVVGICVVQDSRNMNRLKKGRSVPRAQRATVATMVGAVRSDVDADTFVSGVLDELARALRTANDATG